MKKETYSLTSIDNQRTVNERIYAIKPVDILRSCFHLSDVHEHETRKQNKQSEVERPVSILKTDAALEVVWFRKGKF